MVVNTDPPHAQLRVAVDAAVTTAFPELRRTVQKNLAALTVAFLSLLGAARSGQGRLSLGALYRVLPTKGKPHAREKRLHRFLNNRNLDPRGVTDGLVGLVFGRRGSGLWPILFDQTKSGATQCLFAGVPFEGRTLPLAAYTFSYPWQEKAADSQNQIEQIFLLDLESALPRGVRGVYIGDRGYARAALLRHCHQHGRLFVIRGRGNTCVDYQGKRCKLGELPSDSNHPVRYRDVYYHAKQRVLVDVVVVHEPLFKEPWYLIVPAGCEALSSDEVVAALYRERMQIEHSFRDFKTHLGLRGLKLKVRVAERTGRLLLSFCIAYCLALVLGVSPEARQARDDLEIPRRWPRHGTCRTLSVLSIAMQMLSHPRWHRLARDRLLRLARDLAAGRSLLKRGPPKVGDVIAPAA